MASGGAGRLRDGVGLRQHAVRAGDGHRRSEAVMRLVAAALVMLTLTGCGEDTTSVTLRDVEQLCQRHYGRVLEGWHVRLRDPHVVEENELAEVGGTASKPGEPDRHVTCDVSLFGDGKVIASLLH